MQSLDLAIPPRGIARRGRQAPLTVLDSCIWRLVAKGGGVQRGVVCFVGHVPQMAAMGMFDCSPVPRPLHAGILRVHRIVMLAKCVQMLVVRQHQSVPHLSILIAEGVLRRVGADHNNTGLQDL